MVSMLASRVVDCGFEPRSGETKDYKISICCFSAKHATLSRKGKDWLARNQDEVSEWGDMSIYGPRGEHANHYTSDAVISLYINVIIDINYSTFTERVKTGWLGIKMKCLSGVTCLSTDCCFSEIALYKSNSACWSSTKRASSSSH
jgi:hypothetical protein